MAAKVGTDYCKVSCLHTLGCGRMPTTYKGRVQLAVLM